MSSVQLPPAVPSNSSLAAGSTIRVVAARTGIPAMTLRAWEKRFGFPAPERRPGSDRRLYSSADIARLTLLKRVLEKGFRIGDVVHKSRRELDEIAGLGEGAARPSPLPSSASDVVSLMALLAAERLALFEERLRRAAVAAGPKRFVTELAQPLAVAIGEAWAAGEVAVRHEHFASECLTTCARQWLAHFQPSGSSAAVMLGSLPDEPHTLPIQFVALYLATLGANPILLGAQTPVEEFVAAVRSTGARAVGLTVSGASDGRGAKRAILRLRRSLPARTRIWVGGGGAKALRLGESVATVITDWEAMDAAFEVVSSAATSSRSARRDTKSRRRQAQ